MKTKLRDEKMKMHKQKTYTATHGDRLWFIYVDVFLILESFSDILLKRIKCIIFHNILTHTSNSKCFRNVTLINIRGFAEIIVPARGYGRHSPHQVMVKWE